MKKFILSLLLGLTAFSALGFENPFSMEKDEITNEKPLSATSGQIKWNNPFTFDKDKFVLSSLVLFKIYTLLGVSSSIAAEQYADSIKPNKYWKDVATMYSSLWKRPYGTSKMIGSIGLGSAVLGATQAIKPKFEEQPLFINKPIENK